MLKKRRNYVTLFWSEPNGFALARLLSGLAAKEVLVAVKFIKAHSLLRETVIIVRF